MARIEANIKRVRQSIKDTRGRYALRTRALARKMSAAARDNVRANIAPRPAGVFPGYAITGALARKVVASEPQQSGGGWVAKVRVLLTGKQRAYALIHETGGKIKIRSAAQIRAMFASLRRYGQLRARAGRDGRLEYITIRAKRYFAKGIEKTRREWNIARLRSEF
jgi:hypothetical protein